MDLYLYLLIVLAFVLLFNRKTRRYPPLPPGPPADPFIGHLRKIPFEKQAQVFYEWSKKYGPIMHLKIPGRTIIVLNSVKVAVDLLEKRSHNYSDRPQCVVFEIMGWKSSLAFLQYGKQFHYQRRLIHQYLAREKAKSYHYIILQEAHTLLVNLLNGPERYNENFRRYSTAIITRVTYGYQINGDDDPFLKLTGEATISATQFGAPGSTVVDFLPFLQHLPSWFPGTYYAHEARKLLPLIRRQHEFPFEYAKKQLNEGIAEPSFVSHHLARRKVGIESDVFSVSDLMGAAGVIYGAGAETTWSTMTIFILAMVLHPKIQAKAQQEIDAVIGIDRLPDPSDRGSLPFVEGVVQESLRWHSSVPMGLPHVSVEDDIYEGMFIPKGSMIISNTTGMSLDETVYAKSNEFNPLRYSPRPLGNGEPFSVAHFGFGKRICPGRYLADSSLFIAISQVLATFSITKVTGHDGKEIVPEVKFDTGLASHLKPFLCHIKPRSESARNLILQSDLRG